MVTMAETEYTVTKTYSALLDYPNPVPAHSVELIPGTALVLDTMSFTVLKGEIDFQPFEHVGLTQNGELVGVGQVTTYSHNRISDITEVNFLAVAHNLGGKLFCLSAKEVTEEFIKTPEATFLLSGANPGYQVGVDVAVDQYEQPTADTHYSDVGYEPQPAAPKEEVGE